MTPEQNEDNYLPSNTSFDSFDNISSSSSNIDCDVPNDTFEYNEDLETIIASWAIRHNITQLALNDLLSSLTKCDQFKNLPKNSRLLLKTPKSTLLKTIKGGVYHHFGLRNEIKYLFEIHDSLPSTLMLSVGIDGIPISKNPPSQMWPILGYFSNISSKKPNVFIIGTYYGKTKPEDSNEFLKYFVDELCEIINTGIIYNNVKINILLNAIICDTPAKSYILNIKGHTGKHSCLRCKTVGQWSNENKSVYFSDITSSFRNHDEFVSYIDSNFHCGETILTRIPKFDLVNSIPFDFMHCSCIGIMKKILRFWTRSVKRHHLNLPYNLLTILDERINNLGQYIPSEFQRAPNENSRMHPIRDVNRWKATELRQILLYTGMVVFHEIISKEAYDHFMEFCVAMRILSINNITEEYNSFSKSLINHFVVEFGNIYGKQYMSHNVHIILHLADDAKKYGSINNFSAFPFESYMQPLKKKIKNGVKPLQQLARRYTEEKLIQSKFQHKQDNLGPFNSRCKLKNRPKTVDSTEPQYTGWKFHQFTLKLNNCDNCVKMNNNDIVIIENIATSKIDNSVMVIGRKYDKLTEFFDKPCSSNLLHIQSASQLGHLQSWKLSEIKEKMMRLPMNNKIGYVILPLLHLQ